MGISQKDNSFDLAATVYNPQDEPLLRSGIQECKPHQPPNFIVDENIPDCLRKTGLGRKNPSGRFKYH
jgi:hypothetical protein